MGLGKFLFWSSVLSLPTLFLFPRKKPGVVEPGPEEDGVVTKPSDPPVPFEPGEEPSADNIPAEFRNFPTPPAGYTRLTGSVPASVQSQLRPLLSGSIGTVTKLPAEGRDIIAIIEPHFHEPGGPIKPWGWHKGVSLFERKGQVA